MTSLHLETPIEKYMREIIVQAIREDIGAGDITTHGLIAPDHRGTGRIVVKEPAIVCGLPVAVLVFRGLEPGCGVRLQARDGDRVEAGACVAVIEGRLRTILTGERTAINFIQRLSGIATLTRAFMEKVKGTNAKILDTRKTTPGLRLLEKYAVLTAGGTNHRAGLYDRVLVKDNHRAASTTEDLAQAVKAWKERGLFVEVEAQSMKQVREIIDLPIDAILLDNFRPVMLKKAVAWVRANRKAPLILEASGGVTLRKVAAIARAGVDWISVGALTHSASAIDVSMDVVPAP